MMAAETITIMTRLDVVEQLFETEEFSFIVFGSKAGSLQSGKKNLSQLLLTFRIFSHFKSRYEVQHVIHVIALIYPKPVSFS